MGNYKIKLGDKIAFINRLNKQGVDVNSYEIIDNESKGYFEFTTYDPVTEDKVNTILKQSPKINQLKEMAKLTKGQLAEIIREELATMKKEKSKKPMKKPMKEYMGGEEKLMELGAWVSENYPEIAKNLGETAAQIGGNLVGIATVGSLALTGAIGTLVSKIRSAMKKAKGGATAMSEVGDEEAELINIFSKGQ
jgi:hypothetical protein